MRDTDGEGMREAHQVITDNEIELQGGEGLQDDEHLNNSISLESLEDNLYEDYDEGAGTRCSNNQDAFCGVAGHQDSRSGCHASEQSLSLDDMMLSSDPSVDNSSSSNNNVITQNDTAVAVVSGWIAGIFHSVFRKLDSFFHNNTPDDNNAGADAQRIISTRQTSGQVQQHQVHQQQQVQPQQQQAVYSHHHNMSASSLNSSQSSSQHLAGVFFPAPSPRRNKAVLIHQRMLVEATRTAASSVGNGATIVASSSLATTAKASISVGNVVLLVTVVMVAVVTGTCLLAIKATTRRSTADCSCTIPLKAQRIMQQLSLDDFGGGSVVAPFSPSPLFNSSAAPSKSPPTRYHAPVTLNWDESSERPSAFGDKEYPVTTSGIPSPSLSTHSPKSSSSTFAPAASPTTLRSSISTTFPSSVTNPASKFQNPTTRAPIIARAPSSDTPKYSIYPSSPIPSMSPLDPTTTTPPAYRPTDPLPTDETRTAVRSNAPQNNQAATNPTTSMPTTAGHLTTLPPAFIEISEPTASAPNTDPSATASPTSLEQLNSPTTTSPSGTTAFPIATPTYDRSSGQPGRPVGLPSVAPGSTSLPIDTNIDDSSESPSSSKSPFAAFTSPPTALLPTSIPLKKKSDTPAVTLSIAPVKKSTTDYPTGFASINPALLPTLAPNGSPSGLPTATPPTALFPTSIPSKGRSTSPVRIPSIGPSEFSVTHNQTGSATTNPAFLPTPAPNGSPSGSPTATPPTVLFPTSIPSKERSSSPAGIPSIAPSEFAATNDPIGFATANPAFRSTLAPYGSPSGLPTAAPPTALFPTSIPSKERSIPSTTPSEFTVTNDPTGFATNNPQNGLPTVSPPTALILTSIPSKKRSTSPVRTPSIAPSESTVTNDPTVLATINPAFLSTLSPNGSPNGLPTATPPTIFFPTSIPSKKRSTSPVRLPSIAPINNFTTNNPTGFATINASFLPTQAPNRSHGGLPTASPPTDLLLPSIPPKRRSGSPAGIPSIAPIGKSTTNDPTGSKTINSSFLPTQAPNSSHGRLPTASPQTDLLPPSIPPKRRSGSPAGIPSNAPIGKPATNDPTGSATINPAFLPSLAPNSSPRGLPTVNPPSVLFPTAIPSKSRNTSPARIPSIAPHKTSAATNDPTGSATINPAFLPTLAPNSSFSGSPMTSPPIALFPTSIPSTERGTSPTRTPSMAPNKKSTAVSPSLQPSSSISTFAPSADPSSLRPTDFVSSSPSASPSVTPNMSASQRPSAAPSQAPTPTNPTTIAPTKSQTRSPNTTTTATTSTANPSAAPHSMCFVTGFIVWNAANNSRVSAPRIANGASICNPPFKVNIEATLDASACARRGPSERAVTLQLWGPTTNTNMTAANRTEYVEPYLVFGDLPNKRIHGRFLKPGVYNLTAAPDENPAGAITVRFNVLSVPCSMNSSVY